MNILVSLFLLQANSMESLIEKQDQQLQRVLILALIPVTVAFSFFVFVFYRYRREAAVRQKESDLKLSIAEGELKALKAQINPHFIFNCINSIHHYMQNNNTQTSGEYLIKFSQHIRHVLESSSQRMVPLIDEVESNKNYLELEKLRVNNSFKYKINLNDVDAHQIQIPPMVIQPFVENSIWHGMTQRTSGGMIEISFSKKDKDHISCTISDNGAKTENDKRDDLSKKIKKTSLGLSLIKERLDTLNKVLGTSAEFKFIDDPLNEGTTIVITIPFEN